ncbi:MAG TPA: serine/threonine-protein kinase [Polyangia bacterium]|jgi:serine/threonine-protein kinase|nr:serine/threonine-protein kinase [Polyangia bacterium]
MPESEKLRDNQVFGRYRIVRMLGEGGMGAVYEAVHLGLKKRFAIKTLLPSIAQSPEAQARFLREGEAASRMNHPNIVDVTDVGTEGGIPYLVMEYLEGETLGDFVARKAPLDVALAVDLILPAISAVAAGHEQGVIHRDLKPQNIFLARGAWGEFIPKILDFGVSKILGSEDPALTGTMAVLGTASYMSPEQARGARVVDARSDQYSMGLVLFETLTGQRAHDGDHPFEVLHKIASGIVPKPRDLRPDLPGEVEAILMRMLANQSGDRHPSLKAVGRALLPFASDKVRMNLASAFEGEGEGEVVAVVPAGRAGGTLLLPDGAAGPKLGGREVRAPSAAKEITTLGQSALEAAPGGRRRTSKGMWVVGGAVLAAALGIATFVVRGQDGTEVSPSPSEARPPAAAAVALPAEPTPGQKPAATASTAAAGRGISGSSSDVRAASASVLDEHDLPPRRGPNAEAKAGTLPIATKHRAHSSKRETTGSGRSSRKPEPAEKVAPRGANNSPILE